MAQQQQSLLTVAILLIVFSTLASTENSLPVPVTGDNSGPKYDIDLSSMMSSAEPTQNQISSSSVDDIINKKQATINSEATNDGNKESSLPDSTPGLAIRRLWIYSDPMEPRVRPVAPWNFFGENRRSQPTDDIITSTMQLHPKTPVAMSSSPHMHPMVLFRPSPFRSIFADMFNTDDTDNTGDSETPQDSTRSTVATTTTADKEDETKAVESNDSTTSIMRAIDPHRLMLDLLQQALSGRPGSHFGTFGGASPFGSSASGLTPAASTTTTTSTNSTEKKPEMKTETKEDVVEIGGEKYLRKTVVSKHVGENVMFMTKKYILTPLNATIHEPETIAKNETTTIDKRQQEPSTTAASSVEVASTSSTTVEPKVPEVPVSTTSAPTSEVPTTTSSSSVESLPTATPKVSKDNIEKEGEIESVAKVMPEFSSAFTTKDRVVKRKGSDHTD